MNYTPDAIDSASRSCCTGMGQLGLATSPFLRRQPHLPLVTTGLAPVLRLHGLRLSRRGIDLLAAPEQILPAAALRAAPGGVDALVHRSPLLLHLVAPIVQPARRHGSARAGKQDNNL